MGKYSFARLKSACRSRPAASRGGATAALLLPALLALLFSSPFGPSALAATASGERVAMVIGNSRYQNLEPIPSAAEDAQAVAGALRGLGFDVVTLLDGSRGEMGAALQRFTARLSPGAIAVFYYAGHGVQFQNRNFLLPVTANPRSDFSVLTEGVLVDTVLGAMEESGAALKLLLLDASRRNRFVEASKSIEPGLAEMIANSAGTIIVHAAAPGQVAIEDEVANGAFADALTALLAEPVVEVSRLLQRLPARVETATDGRQVPWISAAQTGELFLRAPAPEPEAPVASTQPMVPAESPEPAEPAADPSGDPAATVVVEAPVQAPASETSADVANLPADAAMAAVVQPATEVPTDEPVEGPAEMSMADPVQDATVESPASRERTVLQTIEDALSREDKRRIQAALADRGYYDAEIDGIFGPATRKAIRAFQEATGASVTGWLSTAQLHRLLRPEPQPRTVDADAEKPNVNANETTLPDPAAPVIPRQRQLR